MKRDFDILKIFENADDSLQGVLGYHYYVMSMQSSLNKDKISNFLPDNPDDPNKPYIPLTFSWVRYYFKNSLLDAMKAPFFDLFQSRISLIAMVSIFSIGISNFITCLNNKGLKQKIRNNKYRAHLTWAFENSMKCDIGDKEAIKRLPKVYSIIDDARRIRNLIVHNQGIFSDRYKKDALRFNNSEINFNELYKVYEKNPEENIPIILTTKDIIRFSMAHIEVLHILHNYLQKEYFDVTKPYVYITENKPIEWDKVLWGGASVRYMLK